MFFFGIRQGEEIQVDIEPGKTLFIALQSISEANKEGKRSVFFLLNGFTRIIEIDDTSAGDAVEKRLKGDASDPSHIVAPMPGKILEVRVKPGDQVQPGDIVMITEAMKMEYVITARAAGTVGEIMVQKSTSVEDGDLLLTIKLTN